MAITLRQANVINSPNVTVKGAPLTNSELDNNFATLNLSVSGLENSISNVEITIANLSQSEISNGTSSVSIELNGNITVSNNIIPSADAVYNLGSPDKRFNELFLSSSLSLTKKFTTSNTGPQVFESIDKTRYSSGEVGIELSRNNERHFTKLFFASNVTSVVFTQFGDVITSSSLGNLTVSVNGSNINFIITAVNSPTNVNSTFNLLEI